jgi:hypothetical protein
MNTLKEKCNKLEQRLKQIEAITKTRWTNIDKVINIFKLAIAILLFINLTILFFLYDKLN